MIVKGHVIKKILDDIKTIGVTKIDTENLIIYKDGEVLKFAAASRDTILVLVNTIKLTKENNISFSGAISININTINSAIEDPAADVTMEVLSEDSRYMTISTPSESYNVSTLPLTQKDIDTIFNKDTSTLTCLIENIKVSAIKPISTMIANIGSLCPDNQFKTILYRDENSFQTIFVTATTMSSFECAISKEENPSPAYGIETKSPIVPSSINNFLTKLEDDDKISIHCSNNTFKITSSIGTLISSYTCIEKPIIDSVNAYNNTRNSILKFDKKMMSIKVSPKVLKKAISKASILISKSKHDQLSSYIPITIPNKTSLSISFKAASGSYATTMESGIDNEGISTNPSNPSVLTMCIPIMTSILSTMEDTSNNRTVIEARETDDDKIFVRITPESNNNINYFIRLRK
jgi:hypothetical protein